MTKPTTVPSVFARAIQQTLADDGVSLSLEACATWATRRRLYKAADLVEAAEPEDVDE